MGSKTTSQVTQAANPDAQAAYSDVVGKAQSVANTPYQPYTGELVAGLNDGQNSAVSQLQGAYGAATPWVNEGGQYLNAGAQGLGNVQNFLQAGSLSTAASANYGSMSAAALGNMAPYMAQAQGMYGQAAGLATPQSFDASAVQQYMSPYLSSVVNATQANLQENDAQQREGLVGTAIGNGAYGGDRAGVAQAELARQQSLADGQTIAGLYQQGYGQALGQFNAVQGQRQQGAQLMAGLGQGYNTLAQDVGQQAQQYGTLGQLALGQAGSYSGLGQLQGTTGQAYGTLGGMAGNLGALGQSNLISGASAGLQASTLQQQNAQQQDTAAYNQYMAGLSYPFQNVGFLSNVVQGIGSQEGNTQTTQGNALSSIAGLGTSAIGILGATGGFGANGYLSGLGSTISSAFSDARVKEDIASIGTTHDGQPIYRFRYKGDPKVQMGLMAQDVERRDPGAVGNVGGIKTVDYDRATAGAAMLGLGARASDPRPGRAAGGPVGLGMSPMGSPTMPGATAMAGLGARPRFDDGGAAIPGGGISFTGVPGGVTAGPGAGGLNTSPAALTGGGATAHAVQQPGMRSPLMTAPPVSTQYASASPVPFSGSGGQRAGLGASPSTQDPFSSGFSPGAASGADSVGGQQGLGANPSGGLSQNAWMGVLSAGLGMMSGTSMSGLANIGQGAQQGLQTYLGLERQDKQNAYQQRTLAQTDRQIELKVQEMHDASARAQQQLAIESANAATAGRNADTTASATASENATREQTRQIARYSTGYVPGVGYVTRDLTNPTAAPVTTPYDPTAPGGQGAPATSGAAPPISFNGPPPGGSPPASPPTASAPPPQGGVATSGGAPAAGGAGFTSPMPGSAPALQPGFSGASIPTPQPPQAGAGAQPAPVPAVTAASWKPTTAVPQGYVPPNQFSIYQNPGVLKGEQENAAKTIEATRGEAQAAGGLQMRLDEMDRQYAQLPKTGLLAPGQAATARADIAKGINTFASATGAAPPFDPNALAANENLLKDRFRLGADLAKSMGGREPGFIVEQAVRANPGADNTPLAYQRITAGLRAASQYQQDRAAFFDDYNAKFGHLNGAQQAFDQANPPQAYADRAVISTVDPRDLGVLQKNANNPAALAKFDQLYGQGTATLALRPITVRR